MAQDSGIKALPTHLTLEVVTPDRSVVTEQVDEVEIPGAEGYFGVLPGHTPLLATMQVGELWYRKGTEKVYLSMGLCMKRQNRNQEAEEALRRAVLIRPDLIGALYNLAQLTFERGAMTDAENYLLRFMRLTPAPPMDALVMGVKIARARNDGAAEQSYLQQLRRRFPDAPETQELLEKRN